MSDNERSPRNHKRSRSADSSRGDDRRSKRRHTNNKLGLKLMIQSKDAGSIIGKGGSNIKRLRDDFSVNITVSDSRAPERLVMISGELKSICDVVEAILESFEDKYKTGRRESEVECKMLIHQSQAGCIIGKGGSKLKEFRQESGADVKVYSQCCPRSTERIVQVIGKPRNIAKCIANIVDMLVTWPPRGQHFEYNPDNYDEQLVAEYGGYYDDDRGGRGGRDRDRGRRSQTTMRGGDRSSFGSGLSGLGSLTSLQSLIGGVGRRTTQQVSVPADLAGVIIGKGGQNIRQIRLDSGADVELSDPQGGSSDRIITISGSMDQIQNAQQLLQLSVKQHLARNAR